METSSNLLERKYYGSLDVLKFLCALVIAVHHYQMAFGLWFEGRLNFNEGYFYFGFLVELFFIVSGFLMENSIQTKPYGDFASMLKGKYLRFFPMCFISITAYTVFQWIGYFISGYFFNNNQVISFWNYLCSFLLIGHGWGIGVNRPANSSVWYVNIILIIYIWHFLINKLSQKTRVPVVFFYFAMIILGLNLRNKGLHILFLEDTCATGYFTSFLGMILYRVIKDYRDIVKRLSYFVILFIGVLAVLLFKTECWPMFVESQQLILVFGVYPALVTVLVTSNVLNDKKLNKVSKYLGKLSYEVYLWHFPMLSLMNIFLIVTKYPIVHGYKTMAAFDIVVVIVAILLCKYVEPILDKKVKAISK